MENSLEKQYLDIEASIVVFGLFVISLKPENWLSQHKKVKLPREHLIKLTSALPQNLKMRIKNCQWE